LREAGIGEEQPYAESKQAKDGIGRCHERFPLSDAIVAP
jgi:hypothetical protein